MPSPATSSLLSDCSNCLWIMLGLALVAGVFVVIAAILCERLFRGSHHSKTGRVPSVWRQGGTLWIQPAEKRAEPDVLSRPPEVAPLWIQRSNDWFREAPSAESESCASSEGVQREFCSPGSSSPLWGNGEPTWGLQPHVTLQDLRGFFQHSGRHP